MKVEEDEQLTDVIYTEQKVKEKIDSLRTEAVGGADGISPRILKEIKEEVALPLKILFCRSMDENKTPGEWKESDVVPIFKGGSKFLPKNYRPVNLMKTICKVKEMIDRDDIVEHCERKRLFSKTQHGFCQGMSCQTNLIEFHNQRTKWMDERKSCDILLVDFARAFDKINHGRLKRKLKMFGIAGKLLEWIVDWLRDRRQRVVVEGEYSEWVEVLSSVVQGSVLGPILFIIFIDDIDETAKALVRKFADDTKEAMVVENEEDRAVFQEEIKKLEKWAKEELMEFNVEKCKILHVGGRNRKFDYKLEGEILGVVEEEKDLGVTVANTLKPSKQCSKAAKKVNQVLGQVARAFHYRTKSVFGKLFKTFVRPIVEYAVAAWSPWTEGDCEVLEKVQRRCVRMMSDVRGETYEEKLKDAGLMLLKERRMRGDMIETFKVLKRFTRVEKGEWFSFVGESQRSTRQNSEVREGAVERREEVLAGERYRLEIRKNFFNVRVTKMWNGLPDNVKKASTVNGFKSQIDAYLKNNRLSQ